MAKFKLVAEIMDNFSELPIHAFRELDDFLACLIIAVGTEYPFHKGLEGLEVALLLGIKFLEFNCEINTFVMCLKKL